MLYYAFCFSYYGSCDKNIVSSQWFLVQTKIHKFEQNPLEFLANACIKVYLNIGKGLILHRISTFKEEGIHLCVYFLLLNSVHSHFAGLLTNA